MANKTKLELTWIGKENRPRLEPRILLEDPEKSYHAPHRVTDHDLFDNRLIFGDNLLAVKSLEQEFTGKIKCIYIDPPFNTDQGTKRRGQTFTSILSFQIVMTPARDAFLLPSSDSEFSRNLGSNLYLRRKPSSMFC